MAFVIADRVRETSTTTGTGNFTLAGAVTGYQTFDSALDTGDTTYYAIADQGGANWEVGIGTFTSPSTLARTTILSSSNSGSVVTFGAGTKDVFISLPASKTNVEDQPNLIEVNSSSAALRITQTGAGNALVVEDSANPDSTPVVVDASGFVIQGYTANLTGAAYQSNSGTPFSGIRWNAASTGPSVLIGKSRSATIGTNAIVLSGDTVGSITFTGDDGAAFIPAATITAAVDGTPGTNDMPGRLVFSTTADGASTATERMRIDSSGRVSIGTTSAGAALRVGRALDSTVSIANQVLSTVDSSLTGTAFGVVSNISTQAAAFTLSDLTLFFASGTVGAGSTITSQYGYVAHSTLTGATNNYGFYSNIASGTGRWNFYANGTADNYFAGQVQLGAGTAAAPALSTTGDTNTGIFFPAADTIAFGEGGSEAMRINSSGNVGIGTTSPDALLTVNTVASFGAGAVGAPSIAAKGDLNTGIYFSAADTLDFSTAGTQRGQFDSSGNFKFNSGYGSVATGYGCRAWVNFNGTGTVAIRGSGNVTSITDNGTGDYTVNFTSAMPDANYSISGATSRTNYCFVINDATAPAVGSVRIGIYDASTAALTDRAYVCVNIHR